MLPYGEYPSPLQPTIASKKLQELSHMTFLLPLIQNSTIPPTSVGLVEMDGLLRGSPLKAIKLVSGSLQGARFNQNEIVIDNNLNKLTQTSNMSS